MNHRMRTLAGTLGLAAMALSLGEGVLASVCAPVMDMSGMGTEVTGVPEAMQDMPGMPMPGNGGDRDQDQGSRFDECPLGPALGRGCLAPATLAASAPVSEDAPQNDFGRRAADNTRPDPLLTHALFRPPRA